MKYLIFILGTFLSVCTFAQKFPSDNDYSKEWKTIDSLENKRLPKSQLEVIDKIEAHAKKHDHHGHVIRCFIQRMKISARMDEESFIKSIMMLRDEASKAKAPLKNMIHSLAAESYWKYYKENRYKFTNRTAIASSDPLDIRTWSLSKIVEEVVHQYQLSLHDEELLLKASITPFDPCLNTYKYTRSLRPNLYDLLAHRAIDFFISSEPSLTYPANRFQIDNPTIFESAISFSTYKIPNHDTVSLQYYAIKYLHKLSAIRLNSSKSNSELLVHLNLKRYELGYEYSTLHNKDSLYLNALRSIIRNYPTAKETTQAYYLLGKYYINKGDNYTENKEHLRWYYKKAKNILTPALAKAEGNTKSNIQGLINKVKTKELTFVIQKHIAPNQPSTFKVQYRNFNKVYYRVIKTSVSYWNNFSYSYNYDDRIKAYKKKKAIYSGSANLTNPGDFRSHTTELKLPKLGTGTYVLLMSSSPNFSSKENIVCCQVFQASNISLISRDHEIDQRLHVIVENKQTGLPIANATVQIWESKYNYTLRKYVHVKKEKLNTNDKGEINLTYKKRSRSIFFEVTKGSDYFYDFDDAYVSSNYRRNLYESRQMVLFTDRGIYRPGQEIFFKGIYFKHDKYGKNPTILPQKTVTVEFKDVNYKLIKSLTLTTNDFGTISGTFTAPTDRLTGNMTIRTSYGSKSIRVEEYKRPKFEVSFNPLSGTFKLNDSIQAIGVAKAFAGFNIDGASVKYRVVRKPNLPYWYYWYRSYSQGSETVITRGTAITDLNGEFKVNFKALPDPTKDKASTTSFTYTVYADVTDINGETRSNSTNITIGYKSLQLTAQIPDKIEVQGVQDIVFNSSNFAGEYVASKGNVLIQKVASPQQTFLDRPWAAPDYPLLSKAEYAKIHPQRAYKDENNLYQWKLGKVVLNTTFDTEKSKVLQASYFSKLSPGVYLIKLTTKDNEGNTVTYEKRATIVDSKSTTLPIPSFSWLEKTKTTVEPGSSAIIKIGSSEKVNLLYEVEVDKKIVSSKRISINNAIETIKIPVEEKHRGGFVVHLHYTCKGQTYTSSVFINVPYSNKELSVEFESFRDKLKPGQKEEWKLKITGPKQEMVAAEMVATLYDASLDQLATNNWGIDLYRTYRPQFSWSTHSFESDYSKSISSNLNQSTSQYSRYFDNINWRGMYYFSFNSWYSYGYYDRMYESNVVEDSMSFGDTEEEYAEDDAEMAFEAAAKAEKATVSASSALRKSKSKSDLKQSVNYLAGKKNLESNVILDGDGKKDVVKKEEVKIRKNFQETAFFYPHLKTNSKGEIIVSFTIPEALTKWKMKGFAHTKDLKYSFIDNELVTQKEIMVNPNTPRFFRENDEIIFSTKVSNITKKDMSAKVSLAMLDAISMKSMNEALKIENLEQTVTIKAGQSTVVKWKLSIPENVQALTYRVIARSEKHSDGEEMAIPVLTNRMLVTETLPLPIRKKGTKNFTFEKLKKNNSKTLRHHKYTLEFTSNPAWNAIQSLPYLMEYPYECAEQTFSRLYANSIASNIVNKHPKIKSVFDSWKNITPEALMSNLEKNQELKQLILEETPWVIQSQNDAERKRNVALLFDLNRMSNELGRAFKKLEEAQTSNGGFAWFPGMRDSRYITQHIVCGFGKLHHLGVSPVNKTREDNMLRKAIAYMDNRISEDYEDLLRLAKKGHIKMEDDHLSYNQIHYLYGRSFFKDNEVKKKNKEALDYYKKQAEKYWMNKSRYMQGMIALALHRSDILAAPQDIVKSFSENALHDDEMGMYWKEMNNGYYWYQAPIESQALMIEVYDEVADNLDAVDELKVWLLKNKQTNDWKTTRATVEACYALLSRGSDFLNTENQVSIKIGKQKINPDNLPDVKVEAGTGYFKKSWSGDEINNSFGNISVTRNSKGVSWGAVYWQYFEQLDKITTAETPLKLEKKLFIQRQTDRGAILEPITSKNPLKVGDKVIVRIVLTCDRAMEYVHLKDMRASGFEPINVLSSYKWQDGLGYYEATKDAATNFFMGYLPKGTFVFEYPLRVAHEGDFSNGITTIQCMYAPEFSAHSEGIRVQVK